MAYGYSDGKFSAHFGWGPNDTKNAAIVINSATIYGYFAIKYKGEHVHSKNVKMSSAGIAYGICGCGNVSLM